MQCYNFEVYISTIIFINLIKIFLFPENEKLKSNIMDAVNKSKSRFKRYPELLFTCRMEGLEYATCIIQHEKDLKLNSCETKFVKFRECLISNGLKRSTRM